MARIAIGIYAIALLPVLVLAQPSQATTSAIDPITERVMIAIVSAILSLITGYILFQLKERREPRKRLSYDLEARHGLLGMEESISRYISVNYKGRAADKITYVRCDVKNTGNAVIKGQYLRFQFGERGEILDAYTEPVPPREYDVSEVEDTGLQPYEKRYRIQHLEKQQQVGFRFVVNDPAEAEVRVIPYNEEGDVEVVAGSVSRAADDRRLTEQFVFLFVLSLIVPPVSTGCQAL